ncbi:hypothetical protein JWG40_11510, partial [Leptospira sp. 201903074]|uniref:hypothetical protein n=1 Tax=Leptospira abararensis TaxID=2810036 RepID=UPI00196424B4
SIRVPYCLIINSIPNQNNASKVKVFGSDYPDQMRLAPGFTNQNLKQEAIPLYAPIFPFGKGFSLRSVTGQLRMTKTSI